MCVCDLDRNRKYAILRAKSIITRIGPDFVLRYSLEAPAQVFLPKRYSAVMTDDVIQKINTNAVFLNLVYRGVCATNNAYLLALEM